MLSDLTPIIQQWETASSHLVSALAAFLEASLALECSDIDSTSASRLPDKMYHQLEFLGTVAPQQLLRARESVARTRNRIVPFIHRLPKELLSGIFTYVVYRPGQSYTPLRRVKAIYDRINRLGRVCLTWRDVTLGRSEFWSVIPLIKGSRPGEEIPFEITELCLQRTGASQGLHLVAHHCDQNPHPDPPSRLKPVLAKYSHRIQTLDLMSNNKKVINHMIDYLINCCLPGSIKELSISFPSYRGDPPDVVPRHSPQQASFDRILKPLTALRLANLDIDVRGVAFNGLEELRLYRVEIFPSGALVRDILPAVAPRLRILQISSANTVIGGGNERPQDSDPISFPNLQALYLTCLAPYVVQVLLQLITPGSYRIAIDLTNWINEGEIPPQHLSFLKERKVSELLVHPPSASDLRLVLETLPSITTLHLHHVELDKPILQALTSPPESQLMSHNMSFPRLRELYLSRAHIADQGGFRAMISSHPLELLHLVEPARIGRSFGQDIFLKSTDELAVWLRSTVPGLDLGRSGDYRFASRPIDWDSYLLSMIGD